MELVMSRLLLRELRSADRDAVHGYASDTEVTQYMDWGPNNAADTAAFLAQVRREGYLRDHLLIRGQWRDRLTFAAPRLTRMGSLCRVTPAPV